MSRLAQFLAEPALLEQVRLKPTAFTRNRSLTLPRIAAMMIGDMQASVQAELDGLFAQLEDSPVRVRAVTNQAFSKARQGFSARLFSTANAHLISMSQSLIDAHRWHGLRVIAADASRLQVSTRSNASLSADHCAFALFLPGAELTLHASLHKSDGCERQMLFEALDNLEPCRDILVLDRGYPANWMAAALVQRGLDFCMRVDATGWNVVKDFLRSNMTETWVTLDPPRQGAAHDYELERTPTPVRLIRNVTPTGNVRILMTSLLDAEYYPAVAFGALYHRRWRVEEAFKRIKHRLRLEAVSGLNYLALQQDFAAKIVADNLHILLASARDPENSMQAEPDFRPNRTYAIGILKPILSGCLLAVPKCLAALLKALNVIAITRCRRQLGRSYIRKKRIKPHEYRAYRVA
ncbi:IS4 family transposase [Sodalis endosymbiont of Spalangia cameroni]|uniref:IS4 family transposase n=1 Tax=Sodalis praecaptivus TaxID=1239307 RepID=UPI0031F98E80